MQWTNYHAGGSVLAITMSTVRSQMKRYIAHHHGADERASDHHVWARRRKSKNTQTTLLNTLHQCTQSSSLKHRAAHDINMAARAYASQYMLQPGGEVQAYR